VIPLPPKPPRPELETELVARIRAALASLPGVRIARNNVGRLTDRNGRVITYGLGVGSPDLVGSILLDACPHCGEELSAARFLGVEVKRPDGRISPEQGAWQAAWNREGAACGVARSVEDAIALAELARQGGPFR